MTADEILSMLERALDEYRFKDVGPILARINPSEFTDRQAKKALDLLRRKCLFSDMEKAAGMFFFAAHKAPVVRRQWAQALLDQNRVRQGLAALQNMADEVKLDPREGPEVRGLIGRAYKQLYINEGDKDNLVSAILAYREGWLAREGDYRWHGINLVALLARARQDGVDPKVSDSETEIAGQILNDIEDLGQNLQIWDYATAMESSIALDNEEEALKWARKYVKHPSIDAFELASTVRQMKEIWRLNKTEIGKQLLPVLEYELLQHEGGSLTLTTTSITDKTGFEAVYGSEGSVHMVWMESLLRYSNSVARVFNSATGEPFGTGFLLRGSDLRQEWGEQLVLLTNAHVISENRADEAPLRPVDASVEFTRLPSRPKIKLGELLFSSSKVDLDVSVLRIEVPEHMTPLDISLYTPIIPQDGEKPQRIYVVGHPQGGELTVTLYDNSLVAYPEDRYVHYRSPTEGGNSGSPVFRRDLKAFAIHHKARDELQVNEGVLFEPIIQAISP
jgi:hypothetical protein